MKKIIALPLFMSLLMMLGCKDKTVKIYECNSPVTISYDEWRAIEPSLNSPITLENPGKIYIYKNALYINEKGKGIHVYDNSDPENPIDIGFIEIHANFDVAVKGNTLYAGSYSDLLIFDVSNPLNPTYCSRETDVFNVNYTYVLEGFDENYPVQHFNMNENVVISWEVKTIEEEVNNYDNSFYLLEGSMMNDVSATSSTGGSGVGGSMASFTIMNNTLYVLDQTILKYSSLSNERDLPEFEEILLWRNAETLFPEGNTLFIGTTTGMLIYNIASDGTPTYLSVFNHWTGCDPVVVSDNKAYVTLSSGCGLQRNELHVLDVSDLSNPELIKSYEFDHPLGLGIDNKTLFLCDDYAGLKVFDITNSHAIQDNMIKHYSNINAYDVIPRSNKLIMVGADGVFQYDYSDLNNIIELSKIEVK